MIWAKLKDKILQTNKAIGIEITILQNDFFVNASLVSIKNGQLVKEKKVQGVKSINELPFDRHSPPVSVVINGKGVLVKKFPSPVGAENPIALLLPQANPSEFFYEVTSVEGYSVIALARKDVVNTILSELSKKGFRVLDVSLGFSPLLPLLTYTKTEGTIKTTNFNIVRDQNGGVEDFETLAAPTEVTGQEEYLFAGQYLQSCDLLCYAAAASLLSNNLLQPPAIENSAIRDNRENFAYGIYLRFCLRAVLGVLFLLLLVNFFLFNHYYTKNKQFEAIKTTNEQQQLETQELYRSVQQREQFVLQNGWLSPANTSFFADRFSGFLPLDVWFTSLQFNPLKPSDEENNRLSFKRDTIQLDGMCTDPTQITLLINNIKTLPRVKDVLMKSYAYKREEETGSFTLEITTR